MDNVDYGYKISCGKHKNRTGICTRAADSVDKLWINRKSAHGRHGQRQTGKPRQSGIFPEKTAKIIDFRVDEMGVYEYNLNDVFCHTCSEILPCRQLLIRI